MWRAYYYCTSLAFIGRTNDYLDNIGGMHVQNSGVTPSRRGDALPTPPRADVNLLGLSTATLGTPPSFPSRRAFLQGPTSTAAAPSCRKVAAGNHSSLGVADAARGDFRAAPGLFGLVAAHGASHNVGVEAAAQAGVAATGVPAVAPVIHSREGSAYRCNLPPPPPRRPLTTEGPLCFGSAVGATVCGMASSRIESTAAPGAVGSSASDARGAGVFAGGAERSLGGMRAAGASVARGSGSSSRVAGVLTGFEAGTSAAHARRYTGTPVGAPGDSAARSGGAPVRSAARSGCVTGSSVGLPGTSAVHARTAGGSIEDHPVSGSARVGGISVFLGDAPGTSAAHGARPRRIDSSDEDMLDTPLASLPRLPPAHAALTPARVRASRAARRPRAGTPRGTPSPSQTRRSRGSPSTAVGGGGSTSAAAPLDAESFSDVFSTTSLGFASVRRQVTVLKRNISLANTQQRSAMNKIDSIAVMLEMCWQWCRTIGTSCWRCASAWTRRHRRCCSVAAMSPCLRLTVSQVKRQTTPRGSCSCGLCSSSGWSATLPTRDKHRTSGRRQPP